MSTLRSAPELVRALDRLATVRDLGIDVQQHIPAVMRRRTLCAMPKRKGSAVWEGDLKNGRGTVSVESGAFSKLSYSFVSRFESGTGTNPEELVGAAHAGCFSMALSNELGKAGFAPNRIDTTATVTLERSPDGFTVSTVHLDVTGDVPGIDAADFLEVAEQAKAGCPISKLLAGAKITMDAKLA